ncbi:MAG: hypothetical protein WCT27_00665 [Patescibacteria group bacterium]
MEKSPEWYDQLGDKTPETMERFGGQLPKPEDIHFGDQKLTQLIEKYPEQFDGALTEMLNMWDTKEHRETLGHDTTHISYDMLEFLYLAQTGKISKSEQYLTLYASLLHDLGRYPELLSQERSGAMDFKKGRQIQLHAALSGYLGALMARKYKVGSEQDPEMIEASKAFNRRVIGAALFHGGANDERDPITHHVQSIDRLAGILGSREFVRNVVTDGVQRGAALYPDERLSFDKSFPLFNNLPQDKFNAGTDPKQSWTNIVHYLEMPMRNIFPLSTQEAEQRAEKMKRESGIILTRLTGGQDSPLYRQVFSPELHPGTEFAFPKKRLPENVWNEIRAGVTEEEKTEIDTLDGLSTDELINIMLAQQAPDITDNDRDKVMRLFASAPAHHQADIHQTIEYVIGRRNLNKQEERTFLHQVQSSPEPLFNRLATTLLDNKIFQ